MFHLFQLGTILFHHWWRLRVRGPDVWPGTGADLQAFVWAAALLDDHPGWRSREPGCGVDLPELPAATENHVRCVPAEPGSGRPAIPGHTAAVGGRGITRLEFWLCPLQGQLRPLQGKPVQQHATANVHQCWPLRCHRTDHQGTKLTAWAPSPQSAGVCGGVASGPAAGHTWARVCHHS